MADYTPINADNSAVTLTAGATITGGLLVKMTSDDTVIHTSVSTSDRALGVAAHDAASGDRVTVYLLPGFLHELYVEPGASLAAGGPVVCSTTSGYVGPGTVSTATAGEYHVIGNVVGNCVRSTVDASGTKVRVLGL